MAFHRKENSYFMFHAKEEIIVNKSQLTKNNLGLVSFVG